MISRSLVCSKIRRNFAFARADVSIRHRPLFQARRPHRRFRECRFVQSGDPLPCVAEGPHSLCQSAGDVDGEGAADGEHQQRERRSAQHGRTGGTREYPGAEFRRSPPSPTAAIAGTPRARATPSSVVLSRTPLRRPVPGVPQACRRVACRPTYARPPRIAPDDCAHCRRRAWRCCLRKHLRAARWTRRIAAGTSSRLRTVATCRSRSPRKRRASPPVLRRDRRRVVSGSAIAATCAVGQCLAEETRPSASRVLTSCRPRTILDDDPGVGVAVDCGSRLLVERPTIPAGSRPWTRARP